MGAPPYMKLYVADYLGDTHHLNALEHGAYLLLLMAMWRAGGRLPDNDAQLARLARCTPDEWEVVKPCVMPFFQRARGRITHKRIAEEIAKYEDISGKRSDAGKLGVAKKANKNNANAQAIAVDLPEQLQTYPEPEPKPDLDDVVKGADADDWPPTARVLAELVEAVASPFLDPANSPGLIQTAGRLAAWKRDGASWAHDVLPVVTAVMSRRSEPVATWKFFDAAIARSIAENRAALALPQITTPEGRPNERAGTPAARAAARHDNYARALAGAAAASRARAGR